MRDDEPMFQSLDELCEYFHINDATKTAIRRDMDATDPDRFTLLRFPARREGLDS